MHTVQLGAGFTTPVPPAPPTGDERRHGELLAELAAVRDALWALAQQGPPLVTVPPVDLSEIIHALDGLGVPGLPVERTDPRAIGEAVADALEARRIEVPDRTDEVLEELKRIGRKFGMALANNVPIISNVAVKNDSSGALSTTEAQLEIRYEWQAGAGASVPLYIGSAAPGTPTSTPVWRIDRYTYITGPSGDSVPSIVQTATGAWDNRATLF